MQTGSYRDDIVDCIYFRSFVELPDSRNLFSTKIGEVNFNGESREKTLYYFRPCVRKFIVGSTRMKTKKLEMIVYDGNRNQVLRYNRRNVRAL